MKRVKSFTLLETLLAISIIIMILGTVYAFYGYTVKLTVSGRQKLHQIQMARTVLTKIGRELKALTAAGANFTTVISGDSQRIGFITTVLPSRLVFFPTDFMDQGRVIEHDLRYVEYYLASKSDNDTTASVQTEEPATEADSDNDTPIGLQRDELRCLLAPVVEKKDPKDLTAEDIEEQKEEAEKFKVNFDLDTNKAMSDQPLFTQDLIAEGITYLRFDYYDGKKWSSSWQPAEATAIPRAVQITVGFTAMTETDFKQESLVAFDQRPWHDDRYSLMVSLVLSDDMLGSGSNNAEESDNLTNNTTGLEGALQ